MLLCLEWNEKEKKNHIEDKKEKKNEKNEISNRFIYTFTKRMRLEKNVQNGILSVRKKKMLMKIVSKKRSF